MQKKLGERLRNIFGRSKIDESFFEDLEDALIEADIGAMTTMEIVDQLKAQAKVDGIGDFEKLKELFGSIISDNLRAENVYVKPEELAILLVLGVNGVGKTTTIAKLGKFFSDQLGKEKVYFSAADTFRAAAIDQLQLHGERLGIPVIAQQPGADPGAVVWDTIESVRAQHGSVVIADTAGRMHNKANLVKELQKIDKVVKNRAPQAAYKRVLIIDATTGQNGFRQAELFNEAVPIDYAVLTKYDSSAKGGIAVSISRRLGIPFAFLGVGEKYEDLHPFSKDEYIRILLGAP